MKRLTIYFIAFILLSGCTSGDETQEKSATSEDFIPVTSEEETTTNGIEYENVNSEEAQELIANGEVSIIDVRSIEAYSKTHIPNAKHLPFDELEARQSELHKNEAYLIVCVAGKTSEKASTLLAENGYTNIYNLSGGMDQWTGEVTVK
ncbi:rhodanese-like domain-containing protein [Mesobacillus maritimus]|uniref:rhodanese-like domain-containing protein n=1 Tax=Mesobacillus maritimus TaxID=1643336 RepID=UPI00384EE8C0